MIEGPGTYKAHAKIRGGGGGEEGSIFPNELSYMQASSQK